MSELFFRAKCQGLVTQVIVKYTLASDGCHRDARRYVVVKSEKWKVYVLQEYPWRRVDRRVKPRSAVPFPRNRKQYNGAADT